MEDKALELANAIFKLVETKFKIEQIIYVEVRESDIFIITDEDKTYTIYIEQNPEY